MLEDLAEQHAIPAKIIEYREVAKLKSTYVDTLPKLIHRETGRLHTSFSLTGTATGRLSSSDPNLQNIPIRTELGRQIRAAFVAGPGKVLLAADYSQIELRVMAHLSNDPVLLEAFRNGEDIHARTAQEVFGRGADGANGGASACGKGHQFRDYLWVVAVWIGAESGNPAKGSGAVYQRLFCAVSRSEGVSGQFAGGNAKDRDGEDACSGASARFRRSILRRCSFAISRSARR